MSKWLLNHVEHGDKPWAVQAEAMRRSEGKARYAYFLEQGLGKTSLTFNDYVNNDDGDLCIVVAPQSFKGEWPLVSAEWGRPDIQGGSWPKYKLPWDWETGVYAINYEATRSNVARDLQKLFERRKCLLVIDEATAIKNPDSATTKGVIELAKRATSVRLLNGTPYAQNVMDYYPQLRAIGELNKWMPITFRNHFAQIGGFMGKQIVGIKNVEELGEILDGCSFRALKSEWRKDLPPQIVVDPIHVEMTNRQLRHYMEMMEHFYTCVNGLDISVEMVLTQYDKLRQISSCMVMDGDKRELIEPYEKNPKFQAAFDLHEGREGKTILVYWYKETGRMLYEAAEKRKLNPAILRGGMDSDDLVNNKLRFNDNPDCRIIVVQEQAGCRGHTLLGGKGKDRCNKMVFIENSFAYWMRAQMQDRNHRGAQDQECNIFDIVTSPMDELALAIIKGKKDIADMLDKIVKLVHSRKWT